MTMTKRDARELTIATAAIIGLTVLGWVLSFEGLTRSADAHGYHGVLSWLWAVTPDLGGLAPTVLALRMARRGHGPTGEAWFMAGLSGLVSLAGNIVPFWGDGVTMAFHAWPALLMLLAWHLLFRSVGADADPVPAPAVAPVAERHIERQPEPPALPEPPAAERHVERRQPAQVRAIAASTAPARDARRPVVLALAASAGESANEPGTKRSGGRRRGARSDEPEYAGKAGLAALIEAGETSTRKQAAVLDVSEATVRRWRSELTSDAAGPAPAAELEA